MKNNKPEPWLQDKMDKLLGFEDDTTSLSSQARVAAKPQMDDNGNMSTVPAQAYIDKSIESIEKRMDDRIARIEKASDQVLADNKSFRHTVWTVGITVLLGIGGLIYALTQNMISSFDVGSTYQENIKREVSAQNREINEKLTRLGADANTKLTTISDQNKELKRAIEAVIKDGKSSAPSMQLPYPPRQ